MCHILTADHIRGYETHLALEERSAGTIEKYMRDVRSFFAFLPASKTFDKETVIQYKAFLAQKHAVSTVNAMLAAVNGLMSFAGWHECRVKPLKQQRRIYRDQARELSKAEYMRLLETARAKGKRRLYFLMQTLCATGIRVSELKYITAEAVKEGRAVVNCKGKARTILLTKRLRHVLRGYCKDNKIHSGPIFITKSGKAMNRSNIWTEMKSLCSSAGVDKNKVFPHNFRHLFAVTFYSLEKDIAKLADLLGHASINTTRIYIMQSGSEHIRQIERLGLVV